MNLQDILGIAGFCIALVLLLKEIVFFIFFLNARPKIKIELCSVSWSLRDRDKTEESTRIGLGKGLEKKFYKLPDKIFRIGAEFYIINEGEKEIGIKDMYLRWKKPEIKELSEHFHRCFDSCSDAFEMKRKHYKIKGGDQFYFNLIQEPESRLQILIFKKEIFKHKVELEGLDAKYYEKLPKTIFMEIVVIDQKNRKHTYDFNLKLS